MREGESWFDGQVSPSFLLISGLLLAPAIILQQNLVVKTVQTVLFLCLAVLSVSTGKGRLVVGSFIFVFSTIVVNLITPVGRVILMVGPLRITLGALYLGISKATTLASLLYVSRICVRPSVRLPGVVGRYVSETFSYLNRLMGQRVVRQNLIQRLDELFESTFDNQGKRQFPGGSSRYRNTLPGLLVLATLLIANWGALFFPFSTLLGVG